MLFSSVFEFLSFIVLCVLFALSAVLCVIPCGCMVFPLKVHGFRAVIDSLSNMKRVKYAPLQ